jgi:hypothetical protein
MSLPTKVRAIAVVTLVFVLALATAAYLYVANVQAQNEADHCLYHHCGMPMLPPPPPSS